jgi:hypothetical protein
MLLSVVLAPDAADPAAWLRRLGSPDVNDREAATTALLSLGRAAMPVLTAARDDADPGLRSRVLELCTRIEAAALGQATRVRLEVRDRPIVQVVWELSQAAGLPLKPARPERFRDESWRQRRVSVTTPGAVPFWQAFELLRAAGGIGMADWQVTAGTAGTGPASLSGAFRAQLLGIRRHRHLEFGKKASPFLETWTRPTPTRSGDVGPAVGPTWETFHVQLWVLPEPGGRIIDLDRPMLDSPGSRFRPTEATPWVRLALDEQGRSLRPEVSEPRGQIVAGNRGTELTIEAPLVMPDPRAHRLGRLEVSVPLTLIARRQDPIEFPLAGASSRSFRGSGASLMFPVVKPTLPAVVEVIITPDPPLGFPPARILSHVGELQFYDAQRKLLNPAVSASRAAFLSGQRLSFQFGVGEIPDRAQYTGRVQAGIVAVFRFADLPLP